MRQCPPPNITSNHAKTDWTGSGATCAYPRSQQRITLPFMGSGRSLCLSACVTVVPENTHEEVGRISKCKNHVDVGRVNIRNNHILRYNHILCTNHVDFGRINVRNSHVDVGCINIYVLTTQTSDVLTNVTTTLRSDALTYVRTTLISNALT